MNTQKHRYKEFHSAAIGRLFRRMEESKSLVLSSFSGWPADWLMYKPSQDSWSVLQVLEHLVKTEHAIRLSVSNRLNTEVRQPNLKEQLGLVTLLLLFRLPVRVNVPEKVSEVLPGNPVSLESIVRQWAEDRLQFEPLLKGVSRRESYTTAMEHPVVGAINLRGTLRFLSVHIFHHEYQLNRLRRTVPAAFR